MKILLALSIVSSVSVSAYAQSACQSIWVYHPVAACPAPAIDDSSGIIVAGPNWTTTNDFVGGDHTNAGEKCPEYAHKYDSNDYTHGFVKRGVVTDLKEGGHSGTNRSGQTTYSFDCQIAIYKYPVVQPAPGSCGPRNDVWAMQTRDRALPPGVNGSCLSCDNVRDASVRVQCLSDNYPVIANRAVDLRRDDLVAFANQVGTLMKFQKDWGRLSPEEANTLSDLNTNIQALLNGR